MPTISRAQQKKIYTEGISGKKPTIPLRYRELKQKAREYLSPEAYAYIVGGAGSETTMSTNRDAFRDYKVIPKMLKAITEVDLSIELFGKNYKTPFLLSPIGVLDLAYPKGEQAAALGAAALDVPMIISNQASASMEDIAEQLKSSPRWFQLYWSQSKAVITSLIKRAENIGCDAIVVTLDTPSLGWRPRDLDLAYLPFLLGKGIAQYTSDPAFQKLMDEISLPSAPKPALSFKTVQTALKQKSNYPGGILKNLFSKRPTLAVRTFIETYSKTDLAWEDLKYLRSITDLPIVLKGITSVPDAVRAKEEGIDGIMLSNHGGRQVDRSISPLSILAEVRKRLGSTYPILFDSGIRSGADAMIALALGADAVGIGRPYALALGLGGAQGVQDLLTYYLSELELNMSLSGIRGINALSTEDLQDAEN